MGIKYKLPFTFINTYQWQDTKDDGIALWHHLGYVTKSLTQTGSYVVVSKEYAGYQDQIDIIDTEGCCIRPKKMSKENKEKYCRIVEMYKQGKLEAI